MNCRPVRSINGLAIVGLAAVSLIAALVGLSDARSTEVAASWQEGHGQPVAAVQSRVAATQCACTTLLGSGRAVRIALVPAGFDGDNPDHVGEFEELAAKTADALAVTEPFASNEDRFTLFRVDDYRGQVLSPWNCDRIWYSPILVEAARICDYTQIVAIARSSGCAGGSPAGPFSMAGAGHCPQGGCSTDGIAYTVLHELGHTLAALRHVCPAPADPWFSDHLENEIRQPPPIILPWTSSSARLPGRGILDDRRVESDSAIPAARSEPAQIAQSPLPNCSVGYGSNPNTPCADWQSAAVTRWALPGDPPHGCFAGCDGEAGWFRPWPASEPAIMCRDDHLQNGFTPVERKIIYDILQAPPPPPRPTRQCPPSTDPAICTGPEGSRLHCQRLRTLDPAFRARSDWRGWLVAAGFNQDEVGLLRPASDSSRIEEESCDGQTVAAGIQVDSGASWVYVAWPNIATTGTAANVREAESTRKVQPNPSSPSTLYTDAWVKGAFTIWIDGQNWCQLWPQRLASCPTTDTIAELLGIAADQLIFTGQGVPWDGCKWNLASEKVTVTFHADLQLTARLPFDGEPIAVFYGDGRRHEVLGATVRYLPWYRESPDGTWVTNECELLEREDDYGHRQEPSYHTLNGNLSCSTAPHTIALVPGCPEEPNAAAALLGGQETDWSNLGFTPWRLYRAWKFRTQDGRLEDLRYPGFGDYDFWDQGRFPSPWRGPIPNAEEATFNCR